MNKKRLLGSMLSVVLAVTMTFAPVMSSFAVENQDKPASAATVENDTGANEANAGQSGEQTAAEPAAETQKPAAEAAQPAPAAKAPEDTSKPKSEEPKKEEEKKDTKTTYEWKDGQVKVTAVLADATAIPDDAKFVVTPVAKDSQHYNYQAYLDALNKGAASEYDEKNTLLYDIAFIKDGKELQPTKGTVSITIDFLASQLTKSLGADNAADVSVIHLPLTNTAKNKFNTTADAKAITAGDIQVENVAETGVGKEEIKFVTSSFSVFAYTVDFEYNGYAFSMPGGGSIALSKVFEQLHIDKKAADAEKVTFSNPELLDVEKADGDWKLTSKKAFKSEETLTVEMKDGEKITINVTDPETFALTVNTYDFDGNLTPDSSFTDYYYRVLIYDKGPDGKPTGNPVAGAFGPIDFSTASPFTTSVGLTNQSWAGGNPYNYDDSTQIAQARLFKKTSQYAYVPPSWDQAVNLGTNEWTDSAPDGYEYRATAYDGASATINLHRLEKPKKFFIRIKPDEAGLNPADLDNIYVLTTIEHTSGGNTYGRAKVSDYPLSEDGYIDIPMETWFTDPTGDTVKQETFTGNEKKISSCFITKDKDGNWHTTYQLGGQDRPYIEVGDCIQQYAITEYPSVENVSGEPVGGTRETEDAGQYQNVYDVIKLAKNKDKMADSDYTLEYILNGYNIVTLCPNTSADPSDSGADAFGDGDFLMLNHCMGGVLIRGDILHEAGTGVADSEFITKPSVIGGYVPASQGPFINNRENNNNEWNGYIGSVNEVLGKQVNDKLAQGNPSKPRPDGSLRGYTGSAGTTVVSDDYIDWDRLQSAVISTSERMAAKAAPLDAASSLEVPFGKSVKVDLSSGTVNEVRIVAPEGTTIEDLVGDDSPATSINFVNVNGNKVNIPKVKIFIGNREITLENLGQQGVEDGSGMSIVLNYPDATGELDMTTEATPFLGHIVAPKAYVDVKGGNYNGCVVANKAKSAGEGHLFPYRGKSLVPASLGFVVGKTVDGETPTEDQVYKFYLYELKSGSWGDPIQTKENNRREIEFEKLEYDEEGVHWYLMSEDPAPVGDVTPDPTLYVVKVEVTAEQGSEGVFTETHLAYKAKVTDKAALIKADGTINMDQLEILDEGAADGGVSSIEFKNTEEKLGNLKVTKQLVGAPAGTEGKEFKVTIKNSEDKYVKADGTFSDEEVVLTVSQNTALEINNIPVGTYTVTELDDGREIDKYSIDASASTTSGTGAVAKDQTATVELINAYTQDKGSLEVTKDLEGAPEGTDGKEFKVTIQNEDGKYIKADGSLSDEPVELTVSKNEKLTINDLPIGTYTVTELETGRTIEKYTFDDENSTTEGSGVVKKDDTATVKLINAYTQDKGNLEVTKDLQGAPEGTDGKEFKVTITNAEGKYLKADGTFSDEEVVLTVSKNTKLEIKDIPVGTYTVTELDDGREIDSYSIDTSASTTSGTGAVTKDETASVELVNAYTQDKGNLEVTKDLRGAPEGTDGKEFKVTITNAEGKYLKADGSFSDEEVVLTVSKNTKLEIKDIPVDTYTVTELDDGREIDSYSIDTSASTTSGTGAVTKDETATVELINAYTQDKGNLEVTKDLTGAPEGTDGKEFKVTITNAEGKYLKADGSFSDEEVVLTVSKNTKLEIKEIPVGTYTVTELDDGREIDSYSIDTSASTTSGTGAVTKDETATVELINAYTQDKGNLEVTKDLQGAPEGTDGKAFQVTIKNAEGKYVKADGTFSDEEVILTVSKNESLKIENLPVGTYEVTELDDGREIDKYSIDASASTTSGTGAVTKDQTAKVDLINAYTQDKGSLEVTKDLTGAPEGTEGKAFQVTITNAEGKYVKADGSFSDEEVVLTVSKNEKLTISDLPVGTYTVTELDDGRAIDNYTIDAGNSTTTGSCEVKKDDKATVGLINAYTQDKGSLEVTKDLAGAPEGTDGKAFQVTIKNAEGKYVKADGTFSDEEVILTVAKNASLVIENLPVGTYAVTELEDGRAIDSYTIDADNSTTTGSGEVKKDEKATVGLINAYTQDKGNLEVTKDLAGAPEGTDGKAFQVTIKNAEGKYVKADGSFSDTEVILTVAKNDKLEIKDLPVGTYTVTELETGRTIEKYTFDADSSTTEGTCEVAKDTTATVALINAYTQDKGSLEVTKDLKGAPEGTEGKEFKVTIKNEDGKYIKADGTASDEEVVLTVTKNTKLVIENLPVGTYEVTELEEGREINKYTIDADNSTTAGSGEVKKDETATVGLVNAYTQDKGNLEVTKDLTGAPEGTDGKEFKVTIKNEDGKYIKADGTTSDEEVILTVSKNTKLEIKDIPVGTYTVTELEDGRAIDNYSIDASSSTTTGTGAVAKDETASVGLVNAYTQDKGNLEVTKDLTGAPEGTDGKEFKVTITNAEGKYLKADGSFSDEEVVLTVSKNTKLEIKDIPVGTYTVTELENGREIDNYSIDATASTTSGTGAVAKDQTATVGLVNAYTQDKGNLEVTKDLTGAPEGTDGKEFKVTVQNSEGKYVKADGSFSDTEVVLTVSKNTKLEIKDIPVDTYTVTELEDGREIDKYSIDASASTTSGTGAVTKDQTATVGLVNAYTQDKGKLEVTKDLKGAPEGTDGKAFQVTVQNEEGKYVKADGSISDEEVILTVSKNEKLTISDLPVGTYTVTELEDGREIDRYSIDADNSTTGGTGAVAKDQTATVDLINTYTQDKGKLEVTKDLKGAPEGTDGKAFQVTVQNEEGKYVKADGSISDEEVILTVSKNEKLTISDLPVGTYTVTELEDGREIDRYSIDADNSTTTGSCEVKKDQTAAVELINAYTQDKGTLEVTKDLTGAPEGTDGKAFQVTIQNEEGKYIKADGSISDEEVILTVSKNEKLTVSDLPVGTYTVTELEDGREIDRYSIDADNSTTTGSCEVKKDQTATVELINAYTQDKGTLEVTKDLKGAPEGTEGKAFQVTIKNEEGKYIKADGSVSDEEVILTVSKNQKLSISELPVGTYTVTELEDGRVIDKYSVDAGNSTTEGSCEVQKDQTATVGLINAYTQDKGSLKVKKNVTGAPNSAKNKKFKFTVQVKGGSDYVQKDGTLAAAKYEFEVKGGETVTVKDIPVGDYVLVENQKDAEIAGYVLAVSGGGNVKITKDGTANSNLTNKYTKEKKVSKKVSKTTKGVKTGDPGSNINFFTVMLAALLLIFVVTIYRRGRKESRI